MTVEATPAQASPASAPAETARPHATAGLMEFVRFVATGSIGVPPHLALASPASLAQAAVGPVVTVTSTYDHRVIQGAESGLFLKRLEELLTGATLFSEIFSALRVPWKPWTNAPDDADLRRDTAHKKPKVSEQIHA